MSVETQSSLDILASAVVDKPEQIEAVSSSEPSRKRESDEMHETQIEKRVKTDEDKSDSYSSAGSNGPTANANLADQLRLSIKLKEQQEALISARRLSMQNSPHPLQAPMQPASPPRAQEAVRNGHMQRQSMGMYPNMPRSPRIGGSTNGLKIWTESPFASSPSTNFQKPYTSMNGRDAHFGNMQQPNYSPPESSAHLRRSSSMLQKSQFMQFFGEFYDSFDKADLVCKALSEQLQKSNAMIGALRNSGSTIESLVAKHFREHQQKLGESYALALTDLNRRLKVIEERLEITPSPARSQYSPKSADGRQISHLVHPENRKRN